MNVTFNDNHDVVIIMTHDELGIIRFALEEGCWKLSDMYSMMCCE